MSEHHPPERDPVSGYLTTGHAWNGITELNAPVPRAVWWFIGVTHVVALIMIVLLPAIPLGNTYTKGLLGADQSTAVAAAVATAEEARAVWASKIETLEFAAIQADRDLMRVVRSTGAPLFGDNCAACHGPDGRGGPGYPVLNDGDWLWGDDPAVIHETLRVGINAAHPETRYAVMPAFGRDGLLTKEQIALLVPHVIGLGTPGAVPVPEAQTLFAENCASCHGEEGRGLTELGAPNLTDNIWQYGGSEEAILATLNHGRQGVMPAWDTRLTEVDRKILTLYVLDLQAAR